jgi:hypothetical protein
MHFSLSHTPPRAQPPYCAALSFDYARASRQHAAIDYLALMPYTPLSPLSIAPPGHYRRCRRATPPTLIVRFADLRRSFFLVDADVICQSHTPRMPLLLRADADMRRASHLFCYAILLCRQPLPVLFHAEPSFDNATLRCSPLFRAELSFFAIAAFFPSFSPFSPQRLRDAPPPRRHFSPQAASMPLYAARFRMPADISVLMLRQMSFLISALLFQYFAITLFSLTGFPPYCRQIRAAFADISPPLPDAAPLLSPAAR